MSIQALPQSAVRAIGSSQALTDSASVVKELIDNALDARATSVFVEISTNTLDVIQVRDSGHGIAPCDRPLVAKRYCTSKIKDEKDLAKIGGMYLGFRGEALSSAAEMSTGMTITTRIEGEEVASALNLAPNGDVVGQEKASHPVGTTVRITGFLMKHPVRKQVALKGSGKTLAKIKQLLQSYAFARPMTRLSVRVLKGKSDRDNWAYAPKPGAGIEDVVLKVVGKPCASQCRIVEQESEGFHIEACVPCTNAEVDKINGVGQYLVVDGRPVNHGKGTFKHIVKLYKESLKKANPELEGVKDPFMYLHIKCPEDAYDPNIEPAKDDLLFDDAAKVVAAVRRLFAEVYTVKPALEEPLNLPSCMEQYESNRWQEKVQASIAATLEPFQELPSPARQAVAKTNMYDMDEDDVEVLTTVQEVPAMDAQEPGIEYEDDVSAQEPSSNPWMMAKMNARIGRTNLGHQSQAQLATPAREVTSQAFTSSSPTQLNNKRPMLEILHMLPTPHASSPTARMFEHSNYEPPGSSVAPSSLPPPRIYSRQSSGPTTSPSNAYDGEVAHSFMDVSPSGMPQSNNTRIRPPNQNTEGIPLDHIPDAPQRETGLPRKTKQLNVNKPYKPPVDPERDAWFDIPENCPQAHRQSRGAPTDSIPRFLSPPPNNRDIRSFIGARQVAEPVSGQVIPEPHLPTQQHSALILVDENTAPPQDLQQANPTASPPRKRCDFMPASKLDLNDVNLSNDSDRPHNPRPTRRRRTSENTALRQVNNNATTMTMEESEDPTYTPHPPRPVSSRNITSRRRTTDGNKDASTGTKPQRLKSSQLPLERVPAGSWMQDVILRVQTSSADIAQSAQVLVASDDDYYHARSGALDMSTGAKSVVGAEGEGVRREGVPSGRAPPTFLKWDQPCIDLESVFNTYAPSQPELQTWISSLEIALAKAFPEPGDSFDGRPRPRRGRD